MIKCFSDVIARRGGVDLAQVQIIAETHSENLILGSGLEVLRERVRPDTGLPSTMTSCIVFDTPDSTGQAKPRVVGFDPSGHFDREWPTGFFDERDQLADERYALLDDLEDLQSESVGGPE